MLGSIREFIAPMDEAPPLHSLFAPLCFLDENALLMKTGAIALFFAVSGSGDDCVSDQELQRRSERIQSARGVLDENFTLYEYVVKDACDAVSAAICPDCSGVAQETVGRRLEFLESLGLRSMFSVYAIQIDSPFVSQGGLKLLPSTLAISESKLAEKIATLYSVAETFKAMLSDVVQLEVLHKSEAFTFLRFLVSLNADKARAERLTSEDRVDFFMAAAPIEFEHHKGKWTLAVDERPVTMLTMRREPKRVRPGLLSALLRIHGSFVICSQWKALSTQAAISETDKIKSLFSAKSTSQSAGAFLKSAAKGKSGEPEKNKKPDEVAEDDSSDIGEVKRRLNRGETLNSFSVVIAIFDDSRKVIGEFWRAFGEIQSSAQQQGQGALAAYLSMITGGTVFDRRRLLILGADGADLSLAYVPSSGWCAERSVITLNTPYKTPFHLGLKFEAAPSPDGVDRGVIGMLGVGERGAGKSVFCSALLDHFQARPNRTFILHMGNSYRTLTHKHNGSYVELRVGEDRALFRANPFCLPNTKENKMLQAQFVAILLAASGVQCSANDVESIHRTIDHIYLWPKEERMLSTFSEGLLPHLKRGIAPWIAKGAYASFFDNAEDSFSFSNFQTIDFCGLDRKLPPVVEPLMFYIFSRIHAIVTDPAIRHIEKVVLFDEGWKFLMNQSCRNFFIEAGKMYRHYNAGIMLFSQSLKDLEGPGVLDQLSEICPVKVLLASPGADHHEYARRFKMPNRAAKVFAGLQPRRDALIGVPRGGGDETPYAWQAVQLLLDPKAIAEYGSAPEEVAAAEQRVMAIAS